MWMGTDLSVLPAGCVSRREVDIDILNSLLLGGGLDDVTGNVQVVLNGTNDGLFRQGILVNLTVLVSVKRFVRRFVRQAKSIPR